MERFRVGCLPTLIKTLAREGVGVIVEPPAEGHRLWCIGLTSRTKGVWSFGTGEDLPSAVAHAAERVRKGEHREALAS